MTDTGDIILWGNYLNLVDNNPLIDWEKKIENSKNLRVTRVGSLDNMKIYVGDNYLGIKGSIANYIKDNINSYSFEQIVTGYKHLGDKIGIDIMNGKFTRLDLGENIFVNRAPLKYFTSLGEAKGMNRFIIKNTLYYKSMSKTYMFYNKRLEAGDDFLKQYGEVDCMRFEIKLLAYQLKKISKELNIPCLTIRHLEDKEICKFLTNRWRETYLNIAKIENYDLDFKNVKNLKDFYWALQNIAIKLLGGHGEVMEMIKNSDNKFFTSLRKSRLLQYFIDIAQKTISKVENKLIEELNSKINTIADNKILQLYEK